MIPFSEELSKGVNNADISTEKKRRIQRSLKNDLFILEDKLWPKQRLLQKLFI